MYFSNGLSRPLRFLFRISGTKFNGIRGLADYESGEGRVIESKEGITQIILFVDNKLVVSGKKCINAFVEGVSQNPTLAVLHLIYTKKGRSRLLDDLWKSRLPGIRIYSADPKTNNDVEFGLACDKHTLVVDPEGQLVGLDSITNVEEAEALIRDPRARDKGISEEFVDTLKDLPVHKTFKEVQLALTQLSYSP